MDFKVGIGYDVHRLVKGRKLFLGGVQVPHTKGLLGHSDADVVLHAICDAILGALGKGDIGEHFPNSDPRFKGISSLKLLKTVNSMAKKEGYRVNNVDTVILAEEPNLKNFKGQIRSHIASELAIEETAVNIKATTNEGMGFVGRRQGMAAYAMVSIAKRKK
jgi:2-C-methyl-D-erythritol 2,4-cyclodiphosphate synthase